jgi:fluoride ion exporter CrcB/FEX
MLKNLYLYVKHPYTAGTISVIWLGTLGLYQADQSLPIVTLIFIDVIASLTLAFIGFRQSR